MNARAIARPSTTFPPHRARARVLACAGTRVSSVSDASSSSESAGRWKPSSSSSALGAGAGGAGAGGEAARPAAGEREAAALGASREREGAAPSPCKFARGEGRARTPAARSSVTWRAASMRRGAGTRPRMFNRGAQGSRPAGAGPHRQGCHGRAHLVLLPAAELRLDGLRRQHADARAAVRGDGDAQPDHTGRVELGRRGGAAGTGRSRLRARAGARLAAGCGGPSRGRAQRHSLVHQPAGHQRGGLGSSSRGRLARGGLPPHKHLHGAAQHSSPPPLRPHPTLRDATAS
jgi:hypothetical protein